MSSIYARDLVGAGPYTIKWCTMVAVSEAQTALRQLESLIGLPESERGAEFARQLLAAWKDVLSWKNGLDRTLRDFAWKSKAWDHNSPNFLNHRGETCSKTDAVKQFLLALPPALVGLYNGYLDEPSSRQCQLAWTALLDCLEPLLPLEHRTYRDGVAA